ncbi:hypothetical protein DENSPDRAFT_842700 [Dentipellis sp. KUC8613]|nr:hypothetical protein DENSPDRAFT_842700 [Dentipellis sp. KUC8613]
MLTGSRISGDHPTAARKSLLATDQLNAAGDANFSTDDFLAARLDLDPITLDVTTLVPHSPSHILQPRFLDDAPPSPLNKSSL